MADDDAATVAARAERAQDPADGLQAVAHLRAMLDELERRQVARALVDGWSWSQVGRRLGISKQAAHRRHAGHTDRDVATATPATADVEGEARVVITGSARAVVARAREEASGAGERELRPEHLVAALLQTPAGSAQDALLATGLDLEAVRQRLQEIAGPGRRGRFTRPPRVSAETRSVLERSLAESQRLCHGHLGPEHILLALLRDEDGPAVALITESGATTQDIESAVCDVLKHSDFARSL